MKSGSIHVINTQKKKSLRGKIRSQSYVFEKVPQMILSFQSQHNLEIPAWMNYSLARA